LSLRSTVLFLGWGFLLPPACGPDPEPPPPCEGPDFDVLISASGGDLPADTLVVLIYGSGREEYRLSDPHKAELLFCTPTDADGQPLARAGAGAGGAAADPGGAGGASGVAGASSAGGAAGADSSSLQGVPALHCTLYTQGPVTLEITAEGYPELRQELELEPGKCTVEQKIEIIEGDAGA
jgi:hypothetical protein